MATIRVGSFNLNNLFSRFNFTATVDELPASGQAGVSATISFQLDDPTAFRFRSYRGALVKGKPQAMRTKLAQRILAMNPDVLAVQEVEDVDTLQRFASDDLSGHGYRWVVLVEGNDPRLIDVGVISKLPVSAVTSWRHTPDPANPGATVFSRDLLEVEVWSPTRSRRLFTLYNTHLKSHYVPWDDPQPEQAKDAADQLRQRQSAAIAEIITARQRPNSPYLVVGDMNDPPGSTFLTPFAASSLGLTDGLAAALPDRPAPTDTPPAPTTPWSHRFKEANQPAHYELFDQVWLSPGLAPKLTGAGIGRRQTLGGDGSDHDPVWVDLQI